MSWRFRGRKFWSQAGDVRAIAWLWGLTVAAAVASATVPAASGTTEQPRVWALSVVWFFGALALVMTGVRVSVWGWRKLHPARLDLRVRGGDSASLEVSPSVEMDCYGRGWLVGSAATRENSFKLAWDDLVSERRRIRAGDTATIRIARIDTTDQRDPRLCIDTIGRAVMAVSLRDNLHPQGRLLEPMPWIHMRVVLRSDRHDESWTHDFRFRLEKDWRFRVQDITE